MTEHLPECPVEKRLRSGKTVGSQTCICDALRSREERIKTHEGCADAERIEGYVDGYAAALDAAWEAVADINGKWVFGPRIYKHKALAAINALREKQ